MRLMVRHRDADDLRRCPRLYACSSRRDKGPELPSPGLTLWRTVVDAVRAVHRSGLPLTYEGLAGHAVPPAGTWEAPEQRDEVNGLLEAYLDQAESLGGTWVEPPEENVQILGRSLPVVLDGRLHLCFDHGPDEVEVRKVEISTFHLPPDEEALRTEFSTCVLALLAHRFRPRARTRVTLVALRARRTSSAVFGEDDMALAGEVVRSWLEERARVEEFPATPHALCPGCAYLRSCPAIAQGGDRHPLAGRLPWTVFSPSRQRLFDQCPRRYRSRHVLGLKGETGRSSGGSAVGLAVHQALAEVHERDPSAHRGLEEAARRAAAEMEVEAEPVVNCALTHLELCPGQGYLGGERDLFFLDGSMLIHGRADALWATADGGVEVRDYKTTPSSEDLAVATYAVLAAESFPDRRPVRVTIEDLASARLITREFGAQQLLQARERVRAAAADMDGAAGFPARPGPLCGDCEFALTCPEAAPV